MNKKLIKVIDDLYNLNATISLIFIGKQQKPTLQNMETINQRLGEIIKELRKC